MIKVRYPEDTRIGFWESLRDDAEDANDFIDRVLEEGKKMDAGNGVFLEFPCIKNSNKDDEAYFVLTATSFQGKADPDDFLDSFRTSHIDRKSVV